MKKAHMPQPIAIWSVHQGIKALTSSNAIVDYWEKAEIFQNTKISAQILTSVPFFGVEDLWWMRQVGTVTATLKNNYKNCIINLLCGGTQNRLK